MTPLTSRPLLSAAQALDNGHIYSDFTAEKFCFEVGTFEYCAVGILP